MQELEDAKKFAEESKAEANKPELPVNNKHTKETPDYAAGLSTLNPPTPAPPPAYAPPTPAYAPPTPSMPVTVPSTPTVVSIAPPAASSTVLLQQPQLPTAPLPLTSTTPALPTQPLPVTAAGGQGATRLTSIPLGLNQLQPLPQSALPSTTQVVRLPTQPQPRVTLQASATGQATARIVQLPTQPIPQNRVAQMTATGARQPPPVSVLSNNLQPGARIIRTIQTPSINAPRQVGYSTFVNFQDLIVIRFTGYLHTTTGQPTCTSAAGATDTCTPSAKAVDAYQGANVRGPRNVPYG